MEIKKGKPSLWEEARIWEALQKRIWEIGDGRWGGL